MKLVVLCSGNGTNFENIVTNPLSNKHEVVLMIHNKEKCNAVKRAAKFGIPHIHIPHKNEDLMIRTIRAFAPDLIVLAGYMRILSPRFVGSFENIINVHPSLLPKFKGLKTYQKVLKNKEKKTGCTVHYVNEKLDCGKIIKRKYFFLEKKENEKSLKNKTQKLEHKIYSEAIIDILKS